MHNPTPFLSLIFLSLIIIFNGYFTSLANAKVTDTRRIYIVYLGEKPHDDHKRIKESHYDLLASVVGNQNEAKKAMVYSYRYGFSGFAAKLTASQAKKMAGLPGVARVIPDKTHHVQTTRSWDFLGLSESSKVPGDLLRKANMGDGIIVGSIDSGITAAGSRSFSDVGFGPVPGRWKGLCRSMSGFNATVQCNRKVIGARWFFRGALFNFDVDMRAFRRSDDFSALDTNGHGSQIASIIAGSFVDNVTYAELNVGVARGGAPQARLASYKACWHTDGPELRCSGADLLSAFDYAIHDGVDVISVSVGTPVPLVSDMEDQNGIGIGSFHAVAHGIPVVVAGGNDGPAAFTVTNVEPWVLTVAASTMDRVFAYPITLGNGEKFTVDSYFPEGAPPSPLYFAGRYTSDSDLMEFSLSETDVKGKIVFMFGNVCDKQLILASKSVDAGAVGVIYSNPPSADGLPRVNNLVIPYIQVDFDAGTRIKEYIFQEENPTAEMGFPTIQVGKPITPKITDFSSRGPSSIAPSILKPDIAAPGNKILCATITDDPNAEKGFVISSGTSHAAPHVTAMVALLKLSHPDWSPAAIKSALVTTAWNSDTYVYPIFAEGSSQTLANAFDYGGGIANPHGADDPGLVYDMNTYDYAQYLCSLGYNNSIVYKTITETHDDKERTVCPKTRPSMLDLNLPSMVVPNLFKPVTLKRTVTNVGPVNSVYKAVIKTPVGAVVSVKPNVLRFDANTKKISFTMKVSADKMVNSGFTFGSLTWTDGVHYVRSPIAVRKQIVPIYF